MSKSKFDGLFKINLNKFLDKQKFTTSEKNSLQNKVAIEKMAISLMLGFLYFSKYIRYQETAWIVKEITKQNEIKLKIFKLIFLKKHPRQIHNIKKNNTKIKHSNRR